MAELKSLLFRAKKVFPFRKSNGVKTVKICETQACTGCMACMNACPVQCITAVTDEIGHYFPKINEQACIECGKCQKICPAAGEPLFYESQKAYAAWSLEKKERETSSSGGAAAVFAAHMIQCGGVVYGCTWDGGARHVRIDDSAQLHKLKGSKYVQSYIGDTFASVKKDLLSEKQVLFIGTPCQISGLRSYLERDYDNLLAVDLICHGTPPQKLLDEHCQAMGIAYDKLSFRNRDGSTLSFWKAGKVVREIPHYQDLYFVGFYKGLFSRESCYTCKYAQQKRCGDLTIGDFWGLGKEEPFDYSTEGGVSIILVNTAKGERMLEAVRDQLFCEERTVREGQLGNVRLRAPLRPHKNTAKFRRLYQQYGFDKAAKKSLWQEMLKYKLLPLYTKLIANKNIKK